MLNNNSNLPEKSLCVGCAACANGCSKKAIYMLPDREGFLYPMTTDACIECGHCEYVCPVGKHTVPGPEPTAFAVWPQSGSNAKNIFERDVLLQFASNILEMGGVVFGAASDGKMNIRHICVERKENLPRLQGYVPVQSDIGDCYRQVRLFLGQNRYVLFSGTPCQIVGLYSFLGDHPSNLITIDFMCPGTVSPGVWSHIVDSMSYIKKSSMTSVSFAAKESQEKGRFFKVGFANGSSFLSPAMKSELGRGFERGLFFRPACHTCPYISTIRASDITLGHYETKPEENLLDDYESSSIILINSEKGAHFFDGLQLRRQRRSLHEIVKCNHTLTSPSKESTERKAFFEAYAHQPFPQVSAHFLSMIQRKESLIKRFFHKKGKEKNNG